MIKCVLFDLDGVLADATEWHYHALNNALVEMGYTPIEHNDHLKNYNGLPTKTKINILRDAGYNITPDNETQLRAKKQQHTIDCIKKYCVKDNDKIKLIKRLKELNCKVGVCTNAVRQTLELILGKLELSGFDITLSNEDIETPKPSPEIYAKAMSELGVTAEETLIVEDSPRGRRAAYTSGAKVLEVEGASDVSCQAVLREIAKRSYSKLQILIPMAGKGSRFRRVGYTEAKPFIPVLGKPMIQHVVENLMVNSAKWFFVCLDEHTEKAAHVLNGICDANIIMQTGAKQGAACSAQLSFAHLDPEAPIMIANSDQFININILDFLAEGINNDGVIMTFKSEHPKWSYAKTDENGHVTEVKEKCVISDNATSGIYLWNKTSDFINGVEQMIKAKNTHNNEYYIAPSFNYTINDGKKYKLFEVKRQQMWGLGTPEDLIKFVDHYEV